MSFKTKFSFSTLNLETAFKSGVRKGLQRTTVDLAGKPTTVNSGFIKQEMNKPKTGRKYLVSSGRGGRALARIRLHTASNASGLESSAVLTGRLRRSIRGRVTGSSRAEISANTPYAALQEKGGVNATGKTVAARNNLKRPIEQHRRDIIKNITRSIKSSLK